MDNCRLFMPLNVVHNVHIWCSSPDVIDISELAVPQEQLERLSECVSVHDVAVMTTICTNCIINNFPFVIAVY